MSRTPHETVAPAKSLGRSKPFTSKEYLESLRDGREIWIYGERVKDVTTHPAFRNTVRMLASGKTRGRAVFFLRRTIGSPSVYYLRTAARNDPNPVVRKYAGALAKSIR